MKDSTIPVLIFILMITMIFGAIFGAAAAAEKSENKRIYDNCLQANGDLVYNQVITKCKDIVK